MRCSVLMEKPEMAVDQKRKKSRGRQGKAHRGGRGDARGEKAEGGRAGWNRRLRVGMVRLAWP